MIIKNNLVVNGSIIAANVLVGKSNDSNLLVEPWSKFNEGSGSGLDADLIENTSSEQLVKSTHQHTDILRLQHNIDPNAHKDIQEELKKGSKVTDEFIKPPVLLTSLETSFKKISYAFVPTSTDIMLEEHVSTDWIVSTDENFENIIDSKINNKDDLTVYELDCRFEREMEYFLKVRFNGKKFCSDYTITKFKIPSDFYYIPPVISYTDSNNNLVTTLNTNSCYAGKPIKVRVTYYNAYYSYDEEISITNQTELNVFLDRFNENKGIE